MEHDKRRPSRKPDSRLGKLRQRFARAMAAPPRKPQRVLPPEATPRKGPARIPPKAPAPPPTPATPAMRSNKAMCEELEALFGSLSDLEDEPTPPNNTVPEAPEAPLVATNAVPPTPPPTPGVPASAGKEDPPAITGSPGSGPFQGIKGGPPQQILIRFSGASHRGRSLRAPVAQGHSARALDAQRKKRQSPAKKTSERQPLHQASTAFLRAPAALPGVNRLPSSASRSYGRQSPSGKRQPLHQASTAFLRAPAAPTGASRLPGSVNRFTRAPAASSERQPLYRTLVASLRRLTPDTTGSPSMAPAPDAATPADSSGTPADTTDIRKAVKSRSRASKENREPRSHKGSKSRSRDHKGDRPPHPPFEKELISLRKRTQPLPVHLQTKRPKADAPTDCRPSAPEPDPRRDPPERPRTPRVCLVVSDDSDHGSTPRRAYLADAVTQTV
ncbi:PREDICTED: nascent polypeptide-associated complex subunit alpha, muscle-specific form-like [Vollenhovia emeryi]|uniref:nascent polypeptide-associated complex subunit alpha, muscle-specific form-like n=1 Tax=Vollenhovia emeryi TaxID=411798 RepID=UPI0005F365FF|nr:PREDICTED: nascent polypeptide-associated complex subunit alpha, muscle-specific form-like [Vollenhovia emeryi]